MFGGGEPRRMSVDIPPPSPLVMNTRAMVSYDPLIHGSQSQNSPFASPGQSSSFVTENKPNGAFIQRAESMANYSKKLQDDLQELGQKIKHHEDSVKFLKSLKNKLDESIIDLQVAIGKYHTSSSGGENGDTLANCEKETIQRILRYEKSAGALVCSIQNQSGAQLSDYPFMKDVLGVVATLGKVDDDNLSRVLSEYLGLETMLAVVCKTYEGVKALEAYNRNGLIDKNFGLHSFAASSQRTLEDRFLVICLESLRPYGGELINDDPQRRLNIRKPRLVSGENPPGFLGFAVNMVSIDPSYLYQISTNNGHNLRETLFYHLFSNLQVYTSRELMLKALPYIPDGAISLDGGIMRSPGVFSLGHHGGGDVDVKFPKGAKSNLPESYFEVGNRMKETKWKRDRILEDCQREQGLVENAKFSYESKKRDFVQFLAETSSIVSQAGRVGTPR